MTDHLSNPSSTTGNSADVQATTRHDRELLAMVRIASTILQYTKLDDILAAITRELSQVISFDRSSIAFMSPDKRTLTLQHIYKDADAGDSHRIGDGRGIPINEESVIGWVVVNRKPVIRRDIATDGRFLEVVKEEQLRSDAIVPLIARGEVVGTLNVGSYQADGFGDQDLEILTKCGSIACGAIEHALLLQEANALGDRYRALLHNASDIIMLVNRKTGQLMEVNHRCCSALGYTEEHLLTRSFFDLFPREDQFQAKRDFINILSKQTQTFVDRRLIGRDGRIIFVDINANIVPLHTEQVIQVQVHDVSQRKMLEQQIIFQNKNLQAVNEKLRHVDRIRSEFLSNISHELRTPLSVMIAFADSLRDAGLPADKRAEFIDVIHDNGRSLLELINNLLDLSKLEANGTMLNVTLSHVHDVIRSIMPGLLDLAAEKNVTVSVMEGDDIPVVYIDNKRVAQAIQCIAQNAIKFSNSGGIVEIQTTSAHDGVRITVVDTGEGMEEAALATIFEPFHQGDGSTTRERGGLGIGLAMAKHIIDLHGGRIWVDSQPGVGSLFTMVVPARTEEGLADFDTQHGEHVTPEPV